MPHWVHDLTWDYIVEDALFLVQKQVMVEKIQVEQQTWMAYERRLAEFRAAGKPDADGQVPNTEAPKTPDDDEDAENERLGMDDGGANGEDPHLSRLPNLSQLLLALSRPQRFLEREDLDLIAREEAIEEAEATDPLSQEDEDGPAAPDPLNQEDEEHGEDSDLEEQQESLIRDLLRRCRADDGLKRRLAANPPPKRLARVRIPQPPSEPPASSYRPEVLKDL